MSFPSPPRFRSLSPLALPMVRCALFSSSLFAVFSHSWSWLSLFFFLRRPRVAQKDLRRGIAAAGILALGAHGAGSVLCADYGGRVGRVWRGRRVAESGALLAIGLNLECTCCRLLIDGTLLRRCAHWWTRCAAARVCMWRRSWCSRPPSSARCRKRHEIDREPRIVHSRFTIRQNNVSACTFQWPPETKVRKKGIMTG